MLQHHFFKIYIHTNFGRHWSPLL